MIGRLPLVEFVKNFYPKTNLSNVCVIGHQHLLETTHIALKSLFDSGLKPENVHLLGKCYSSNLSTYHRMKKAGINVSNSSFDYNSHRSYDAHFEEKITAFLGKTISRKNFNKFDKIVILDDGGYAIKYLNNQDLPFEKFSALEQTTSGYEKVKKLKLNFPVINVARSEAKLVHETPMISEITIEKLNDFIARQSIKINKTLIIGGGFIGSSLYDNLNKAIPTKVYDQSPSLSHIRDEDLVDHLATSDLIIGCTGTKSIPANLHQYIHKSVLVSTSSSDREFDAVEIRKQIPKNSDCHKAIETRNITLVNSGFPVNFDGNKHSVAPEKIQLTRSLLILGIFQGIHTNSNEGLINLDREKQFQILHKFYTIVNNTNGIEKLENSSLAQKMLLP